MNWGGTLHNEPTKGVELPSPASVTISLDAARIALRAVRFLEPSHKAWAMMPKEEDARRVYAEMFAARREIEDAVLEAEK